MVSPTSRWTATPLLILLLSSTTYAQYTLRGRVVQDHHKHALGRRAEPAARPSDSGGADESAASGDGADTSEAGGDDSENPAGPEASSSTQSDKGDEGDAAPEDGVSAGSDGPPTGGSETGGGGNSALYLVSHEDFCVYGPSEANTPINSVGDNVVSWCTKDHGSKTIPEGTLSGVTYVKTPNYVQVSGYGDFTKINIAADDKGGQFDSSEHTPSGAQLLLGADKSPANNWVTLIGHDTFCVRACTGDPQYCPTQYDTLGCIFLTNDGVGWPNEFQDCEGEDGDIPGVFDGKTYTPGSGPEPTLHAPAVSNCNNGGGPPGGAAATASDHKSAAAHESGNSSAHGSSGSSGPSGSGSASSSEEWLPVETCVPCAGAGAGAASSGGPSSGAASSGPAAAKPSSTGAATPALSGTTEVGMSQLQTGGSLAGGASAIAGSPTTAPKPGGDALVQKRQAKSVAGGESDAGGEGEADAGGESEADGGEDGTSSSKGGGEKSEGGGEKTVTKGDQCCFTTWTQAAGGAKATGTGATTGTGAGAGKSGATSAPFSGMSVAAPSASKAVNGSGVAGAGNKTAGATNGTGNGTGNGTESGAESWRGEAFGMDGMGKIVGGLIIGLMGGGWSLV